MHRPCRSSSPVAFSLLLLAACSPATDSQLSRRVDELDVRARPGLHSLMIDLQFRHANIWFAAEAGNWPLAGYHMHEIEELAGDIGELHPEYEGIPVAELMVAMLAPTLEQLAAAVAAGDGAAFEAAFDGMTAQCNACHQASDRGMLVVQRPRVPPLDNIRFAPPAASAAADLD